MMPRKVLVIGYGNSLRGDDAFGPLVADRLEAVCASAGVEVLSRHLLTPELAEDIRGASLVIFIDASAVGAIGEVCHRPLLPDPQAALSMAHHLEPGGLLRWVQQAYQHVPEACLISARGEAFGFADAELSPVMAAAVPRAIGLIRELIRDHLAS